MDQKQFEERLDGLAEKISATVTEGVRKVEEAFDKGKENLNADEGQGGSRRKVGSPKAGVLLLVFGLVWILNSFDFFDHRIFPVLMIAAGVYLIIRDRDR